MKPLIAGSTILVLMCVAGIAADADDLQKRWETIALGTHRDAAIAVMGLPPESEIDGSWAGVQWGKLRWTGTGRIYSLRTLKGYVISRKTCTGIALPEC